MISLYRAAMPNYYQEFCTASSGRKLFSVQAADRVNCLVNDFSRTGSRLLGCSGNLVHCVVNCVNCLVNDIRSRFLNVFYNVLSFVSSLCLNRSFFDFCAADVAKI